MTLGNTLFREMAEIRPYRSKRVSSWDRTGGNQDCVSIGPGKTAVLADIAGPGCIKHIFLSAGDFADRPFMRKVLLRMYWDNEEESSVEVPFGDFFGLGHCAKRYFTSLLITVNPGIYFEGSPGFSAYFPMPFSERARIEIVNEADKPLGALWFHIEYDEVDNLEDNLGRFHAQWRRENPTQAVPREKSGYINLTGEENYVILDAEGEGNFAGFILNVDNLRVEWYGEGDDMIFIDGEKWPPSYHGTGTEEIFSGGPGPSTEFAGPYTGFHLITNKDYIGKTSMYRFYVTDPIRFHKSIKATIEHGHANDRSNDYSSVAFWYQKEPHKKFPLMLPVEERMPRISETLKECLAIEKKAEAAFQDLAGKLREKRRKNPENVTTQEMKRIYKLLAMSGDLGLAVDREELEEVKRVAQLMIELAEEH